MPNVILNRKVFETLVGKKLPIEKLKDRISMLGTDLDSVSDTEIEVEVFPNRPDMLSEQGFARAFRSFIGVKTGLTEYKVNKTKDKVVADKSLPKEWPYVCACIVKGLNFDDERIREVVQIQEKLGVSLLRNRKKGAIGLYPLDNITFPVTLKGEDPNKIKFRPLEFPSEITGRQILSKHPTGKKYSHICESWKKFPVFRDSKGLVLSMPPIINSHTMGKIDETTKDVFVECTGTDKEVIKTAMLIIVSALADMGGSIHSLENINQNGKNEIFPDFTPRETKLDIAYVNKLLGLNLKDKEVHALLEKMGYGIKGKNILVPAYRVDILHQVDLIEDVAIAYGYENFVPEIPKVSTVAKEAPFEVFKRRITYLLVGLGYLELNTYNITSKINQQEKMDCEIPVVSLANALNVDCDVLRAWIIPSLMEVFSKNKHHDYPQFIFDIGTVFKKDKKQETNVLEQERLAVAKCGEGADYTEARQVLECILDHLGLEYNFKETEHPSFIPGRVARVSVGKKEIAYVGELHPSVLSNWDLTMPVCAFELNLTELFKIK